jgi:glycine/D-amino acid oxidase-like deaminating enzyme
MASVVMVGGGIAALTTAILLADDGHVVTVLERDETDPTDACAAWERWQRPGVSQFRLPHLFASRFRVELDRELPRVVKALDEAGTFRFRTPAEVLGQPRLLGKAQAAGPGWRDRPFPGPTPIRAHRDRHRLTPGSQFTGIPDSPSGPAQRDHAAPSHLLSGDQEGSVRA